MSIHKFDYGQTVQLSPAISRNVRGGFYKILKQLPENNGEFEYRVKSENEPHQRVVRESELEGL